MFVDLFVHLFVHLSIYLSFDSSIYVFIFVFIFLSKYLSIYLLKQVKVGNFSSDWNDGIALASLVDATAPGLFPDWEDLNPANRLENAKEAMKKAEDWLGIPQVPFLSPSF